MKSPSFATDSFRNTPRPEQINLHPDNDRLMEFSRWSTGSPGVHFNLHAWTIPPCQADARTPLRPVARRILKETYGRRFRANPFADGFTLYGEVLWSGPLKRSWNGTLEEESLFDIDRKQFRYLAPECCGQTLVEKGMIPLPHDGITRDSREVTGITPAP